MNKIPNTIISLSTALFFLSSCHTLEHQKKIMDKQNFQNQLDKKEKKVKNEVKPKITVKRELPNQNFMAPITKPKSKMKVKAVELEQKIKFIENRKFNLKKLLDMSEKKLIEKMGKSHYTKQEGKLKNHQYYFTECYLDVYLINKKDHFFVNFLNTRATKLNGKIKIKKCLKEIANKFN